MGMTCNVCEEIAKEHKKIIVKMINSQDWVVESVECDNEVDSLSHDIVRRYLTIHLRSR